jgi:cytochrome P450
MTVTNAGDVYYDPYDVTINADPYPIYARLREEAPLYRNDEHDFYAVSRFEDVQKGLGNRETFISGRGGILELIKANIRMPPGVLIFEDPPVHTVHRGLLSRVFTPRKMNALEDRVRDLCAQCLDPLVGESGFDLIAELGAVMPMRVIGMLLGIPEEDQESIRDQSDAALRTKPGKPMRYSQERFATGEAFADYVDWRVDHPSDDLMTELLNAEVEDETGTTRRLSREEILTYVNVVAGAGNETTTRLIGWAGKALADNPDQRRRLVEDRALVPNAIEEILRYEPPAPHVGRYVDRDIELHGETVAAGSIMLLLVGAANRDERRYPDPDRLEGRVALDELLQRFPEWDVDIDNARLSPTSTVRGWETLPLVLP